jgi:hypothetical protein
VSSSASDSIAKESIQRPFDGNWLQDVGTILKSYFER